MNKIKKLAYKLKSKMNLQFIKHSLSDMKRERAKVFFGIAGIAISIFLLTAIGIINDTISYNHIKIVTSNMGEADILITKTPRSDLSYDPFFDENIIHDDLADIEGIDQLFPRILMLVETSSDFSEKNISLEVYGLDFKLEAEKGSIGDLYLVDDNNEKTSEIYEGEPKNGECVILKQTAELMNVSRGQKIHLEYNQNVTDLTVIEICEHELKFMRIETALILVNLNFAQGFFNRLNQINIIFGVIKNPTEIYDSSNMDLTIRSLREISARVQERLDFNEYTISMPKLQELEKGIYLMLMTTIAYWFITILSVLITGILINAILSTSAEERMREFGILKVVGGRKRLSMNIVLFEGVILGVIGSLIGILLGFLTVPFISEVVFNMMSNPSTTNTIETVIKPFTIIFAFTLGLVVSISVAMIPAIKTVKIDIIKAITPFQIKEEGWEVVKEGSMNVKSFFSGIAISTIGIVVFALLPRIIATGDYTLTAGLFIGLLCAILVGLVLTSVGIIPLIQKLFLKIISPAIKKYSHIIAISLRRYRRRNTSTVVMFAISFSFIFFLTGINRMQAKNLELNLKVQYGSDLVIINQGEDDHSRSITLGIVEELKLIEGIEKIGYALHNTYDIQAGLSAIFGMGSGGMEVGAGSPNDQLRSFFASHAAASLEDKYMVEIGDYMNFDKTVAGFIGIDKDFINLIDQDYVIWESPNSGFDYSFSQIFERNNTCIIAKSIAKVIGISDVGENVRLTFYDKKKDDDVGNSTIFEVVGISGGIPGFWNFKSNEMMAFGGGVMVSVDTYSQLMDVKNPGQNDMIVDKIFINLEDNSVENINKVKDQISGKYKERDFLIDDAISKINYLQETSESQSIMLEIILLFTVLICIFGLISSMYSIILERKFEIGILRSMGMKSKNVRNMFLIESFILLFSAGIMGTIVGSFSAYLLQTNMSLISELPAIFSIPTVTLFRTFIFAVIVGIIGMYLILRKLSRLNIMDIFRQTF